MLEAHHYTAQAQRKGSYALPPEFDGRVNQAVLWHAVRAYMNNQRQGTASTKSRSEVSGGNQKPWRQKGTGRARHGSIRAPQWAGGGVVFGPKPRSYRTDLPRKVRRLARLSALNARATDGAIYVIEQLAFEGPRTRQMAELIEQLGLTSRKVLILTAEARPDVYLSGRNLPNVHVLRYADAAAYDLLWADALIVEETAVGGHHIEGSEPKPKSTARARRAKKAAEPKAAKKKTARKTVKKKAVKKKKGGRNA